MRKRMMVAVAAACLASGAARADELQARVLAGAKTTRTEGYAFRRTLTVEATGEKQKVYVERYDPRSAARWTLMSVDGRAPTGKETADAAKSKRGPHPSYARLAEWIGSPAARSEPAPGYVLYKFPRLPAGTAKFGSHDASADTRAEALVNAKGRVPFVERVRFTSTKGFRMMLVASVKGMTDDSRYRQHPYVTVIPDEGNSVITGSMLGKSGQMRTKIEYAGFERVR